MLIAENRGKILAEAQNHEDYLTSAVFGHLRYIPPKYFWQAFFDRAKPPIGNTSLASAIDRKTGHSIGTYAEVETTFWPNISGVGQPDLVLRFSRDKGPAVVIVIEVKLESGKSGYGEWDQLAKYFENLDKIGSSLESQAESDSRFLLYLTPRESLGEVEESLKQLGNCRRTEDCIYRIRWQDLLEVVRGEIADEKHADPDVIQILKDIATFLTRRGFERFDGFNPYVELDELEVYGGFLDDAGEVSNNFCGFRESEPLECFSFEKARWAE